MKKIPMLEKFAAQSLVEYDGELIFSKEKFAELIVRECAGKVDFILREKSNGGGTMGDEIREHFGVEE
jgi:hypothetical protein